MRIIHKIWREEEWIRLDRDTRRRALDAPTDSSAWRIIARQARTVLRIYSTSFFLVTRFLPPAKRAQVEAIYAAVRYPDEIVDTFQLDPAEKAMRLNRWLTSYEEGLIIDTTHEALERGLPCFITGFTQVVRRIGIPHEHYRAFINAMRHDISTRPFATLDDLIDGYIYGSAIVVGYFLTYVYGAHREEDFDRALACARNLGIALQLTNFLRDVAEDASRGRLYLPLDMLYAEGIDPDDVTAPPYRRSLVQVIQKLGATTDGYYRQAEQDLDAFAMDSRIAIRACIDVYRQLNTQLCQGSGDILTRASVSIREKFRVLPSSKYWRLPMAYLQS